MRTAFSLTLLAGLAGLPIAQVRAQDDKPKPKKDADATPIVVPFELLESRHMAIQVKVNGKGPYRLIFDTGAPMNLVSNKLAIDAELFGKGKKPGGGLFGSRGAVTMDTLEIGDIKLEKMPATVMDHPTVAALAAVVGPLEGIIGFPFFARYRMTIDYQKKEMTLVPSGYVPGDYMTELTAKLMEMQKKKGGEPTVLAPAGVWGLVVGKDKDDEDAGVVVERVLPGGAAAAAGLKAGDRLLTIDGRWTDTVSDTFLAASLVKPGREIVVVVRRDGKELKVKVKPGNGT